MARINEFAGCFRRHGAPVVFVAFDGESHCEYRGDDGDEWFEGIETSPSDIVVHKRSMSCFKDTDLEHVLRGRGVDCILLAGAFTEFCVISTYFSASDRGIAPFIGRGASIAYDHEKGNPAAEVLCNVVEPGTVETFLSGGQRPFGGQYHRSRPRALRGNLHK